MSYIRWFKDLTINDIPLVGGKNASLGEMYSKLTQKGVPVPNGFAVTAEAYWAFIRQNKIDKQIKQIMQGLDVKNVRKLSAAGAKVRELILRAEFPEEVKKEIVEAYCQLGKSEVRSPKSEFDTDVAVRSSATAEDLPDASFAGQQESYLNVKGEKELLESAKKCVASLFTDRAISYREAKGFDHFAVALSVGVQQMARSDLGASGVMFTLDTESGFKGVVLINASYGLGEYVVKGRVTPDQFFVFKDGVKKGFKSLISRRLGSKEVKLVYANANSVSSTKQAKVPVSGQKKYCLSDDEILQLAKWGMQIEEHYGHPMDIEWAKDGQNGQLYIVQARSETVKSRANVTAIETYKLGHRGKVLLEGVSVGQKIGQGKARLINSPKQMKQFKTGEVLVTRITDPDWEPVMRLASAIITEQGGKTSHAAIVSRELGIPCLVGVKKARSIIKPGQEITVSCAEGEVGYVYEGRLPFEVERTEIKIIEPARTKVMMNVGDPDRAFYLAHLPNDGVGLAREEFIFTNFIKIHPLALINYNKLKDRKTKKLIDELTVGYEDKSRFVVDKLAEGIAFIAAAFSPHDVILRFSDFKTNEYATLIGGAEYEPKEENPMLGWRGASRYYDEKFKPAFKLECEAIKKVREEWGLKNVIVMVPFCRTVEEGKKVLETMKEFGLERGQNGLQVYVMCEIPSNVLLAKEFAEIFDGFSIGSNDLTQLTLGLDRDSALVSHVGNENNLAVKKLIREVIQTAHQYRRKVGICGQGPSDYPEFCEFLVQEGIDSISLNPDTVVKTRQRIVAMEKKIGVKNVKFSIKGGSALGGQMTDVKSKPFHRSLEKSLTIAGIAGLFFMLTGITCQTVGNNQAREQEFQQTVALESAKAKAEARRQFEKEKVTEKRIYSEDSFVKFNLAYPAEWTVSHGSDYVNFLASQKGGGEFSISRGLVSDYLPANLPMSTTTIWGRFPAEVYVGLANDPEADKIIRLYPGGFKKSKIIVQLAGSAASFDEIFNSIKNFEITKE